MIETSAGGLAVVRAALRALRELDGWEAIVLRTARLAARPSIPLGLRDRVHVRTARARARRAPPAADGGDRRPVAGRAADGCGSRPRPRAARSSIRPASPRSRSSPRPRCSASPRTRRARERDAAARRAVVEDGASSDVAERLEAAVRGRARRRRPSRRHETEPLADRDWIVADLHMHTSHSHDCSIEPADARRARREEGLGAIAVTDHNVFGGALEAAELARGRDLIVIPGEEVKTDRDGEVIGLFLHEEIPRGMSFADTIAAIREQEGVVYLPHPFDRMHAIPAPATLHRHLPEIDVLEVYNARLLFDAYNDEALRFARKYGLLAGAGSDAHVLQGVGTGALRMRRFDGPEEFLARAPHRRRSCADRSRSRTSSR